MQYYPVEVSCPSGGLWLIFCPTFLSRIMMTSL